MTRSLALVLATLSLAAGACAVDDGDLGTADFALTGHSPSGTLYRLRHADLTIAGPGMTQVFHTEDAPDAPSIAAHLPAGAYTLALAPAWTLERVAADGTAVTVDASLLSANPLGFDVTPGGLTPVVLRFQAGADQVGMGDGDVDISIGVDDPQAPPPIIVTNPPSLTVTEGSTAAVQVLVSPSSSNVTVAVSSSSPAITVSPNVLVFTPGNAGVPQVLTVTGVQDPDADNAFATIALTTAGGSSTLVAVQVIDDDVAAPPVIVVDATSATLMEGASTALPVHLSSPPSGPFVVQVATSDPSVLVPSPTTLVFDPVNWSTSQLVTVTAVKDSNTVDNSAVLTFLAPGAPPVPVTINVVDADVQQLVVTPASIDVNEGGVATVQVRLAFQPVAITPINLTSSDSTRVVLTPSTLVFDPSNWAAAQIVTVKALPDPDGADNTVTVALNGAGLPPRLIAVTVHEVP